MSPPILILDDSPAIRATMKKSLQSSSLLPRGTPFLIAPNGREGLDILEEIQNDGGENPLFIICDGEMPRMDGWEFLRHLREHPIFQFIPVLWCSPHLTSADLKTLLLLGARGVLFKPFDEPTLLRTVATLLKFFPPRPTGGGQ